MLSVKPKFSNMQTRELSLNHNQRDYKLNPWWVTGFCDGESSFSILIRRSKTHKIGWSVELCFQIDIHKKDSAILEQIKNYFGVGEIYNHRSQTIQFRVQSIKSIINVIDHFDKYPLVTQKQMNYQLFKMVINLIVNKEHLTIDGLHKILSIKAALNNGLSGQLAEDFPNITPISKPLMPRQEIPDHNWLAGFVDGEGCFFIKFQGSSSHKLKEKVSLSFIITQHIKDELLMRSIIDYLGCGNIQVGDHAVYFRVDKFLDINEKIIPFFDKYPLLGIKSLDYLDWCKAVELINNKDHLTKEGLEQLRILKTGMNRGRTPNILL